MNKDPPMAFFGNFCHLRIGPRRFRVSLSAWQTNAGLPSATSHRVPKTVVRHSNAFATVLLILSSRLRLPEPFHPVEFEV